MSEHFFFKRLMNDILISIKALFQINKFNAFVRIRGNPVLSTCNLITLDVAGVNGKHSCCRGV